MSEQQNKLVEKLNHVHPSVQCIIEALDVEPELFSILWEASTYDPRKNRWYAYEQFKRRASNYVGFGAARRELRTTMHYEAMMRAIEYVLPDPDRLPESDDPMSLERGA